MYLQMDSVSSLLPEVTPKIEVVLATLIARD
jgi:hypothetical protein